MPNKYIFEGKTTTEAIENGLKELKVSKDKVDIKVIEEDKRSFFSILTPRIIKVEMSLKSDKIPKKVIETQITEQEIKERIEDVEKFLQKFIKNLNITQDIKYEITSEQNLISVNITGENINYLIGYRGDVLNSLQTIISSIINKHHENKVRVLLNIEGYREKREKALEDLAEKITKTVLRTQKSITLEPMTSYERKIIHSKLQNNEKIKTYSIGEEPYRRIVISIK